MCTFYLLRCCGDVWMLKLSTVAMTGWLRLSHCRALDLDIAWMGLDGRSAVHRVSGICPKQPWTSVVGMLPPLCHEDFMRHIYDNVDAFLQASASCGNLYNMTRTKSKHLKVFFSSCFFRHLFLAIKSSFFPASLTYFHLWIFGTEKKNQLSPCSPLPSNVPWSLKNRANRGGHVGDLRTLRCIRGIEVWKLRDDWQGWRSAGKSSRSWDFVLRIPKRNLSNGPPYIHRFSWCFAVLNAVFLRNTVLKYTTIHEFNALPTDRTI